MSTRKLMTIIKSQSGFWTVALVTALILAGVMVASALAQENGSVPANANEFISYLSDLNAMAVDQTIQMAAAPTQAQAFTTQMDALRAQAYQAEIDSGARFVVQDANAFVTQLDELRHMDTTVLFAQVGE
jgi:hypothetical protein